MKDDGHMARVPDLDVFCRTHNLLMITVADLVAYRLQKDPIVRAVGTHAKETKWGPLLVHKFQNTLDKSIYLAFQIGDVSGKTPLVRVHLGTLPDDLEGFGMAEHSAFHASMEAMQQDGCGILVFLHHQAWDGAEPVLDPANREVGIGAQILGRLGITKMRLLTRQEKHYAGLKGFGLNIVAYEMLEISPVPKISGHLESNTSF
jgi:3,4-dihydroxy 2-butanone 4-phosphate synthase/GTP cyclohydrolase II